MDENMKLSENSATAAAAQYTLEVRNLQKYFPIPLQCQRGGRRQLSH